ncbi:MAG: hypothetical protein NT026_01265 [Candidatus Staskawiczbacteria bacterium]|nr:hypothetical protein [Candidatus Staskawiczbacteria bacterium]
MKGEGQKKQGLAPPDQEAEEKRLLAAINLANRIKSMEQEVRRYKRERYPLKSIEQILRKIREHFGAFGEAVAIAMVKRTHRPEELDLPFIAEEEAKILQLGQPLLDQNQSVRS